MHIFLLLVSVPSRAASLDLIEVGGAWGTPAATNPTALWWNPAGLAVGTGTQLHVEVAPTIGTVIADRANPDYGEPDPAYFQAGYPDEYDHSGTDRLRFVGAVPFLGASTDFGLDGLGVGIGWMVPIAKGGVSDQEWGANRYALREGSIQHIYTTLGAGYRAADRVAFGASFSMVHSRWKADTDATVYPDLAAAAVDVLGLDAIPDSFQDAYVEQRGYTAGTVFDLRDTAFTFGAGVHLTPLGNDKLGISLAYNHGMRLENTGELTFRFQCPPEYDQTSFEATHLIGTCNATAVGEGSIGYDLPGRVHLGVAVQPLDRLRLELMGAYVFWSVFTDYDVTTQVAPTEFTNAQANQYAAEAARLATQERQWARDNRDTFWVGVDAKGRISELLLVGGRVTYDRAAVPTSVVSANNYDADSILLSGLVDLTPLKPLSLSLSYTNQILAKRVVTDSAYAVGVDASEFDPRYFYPSSNGTYTGSIHRIGLTLRGRFGP